MAQLRTTRHRRAARPRRPRGLLDADVATGEDLTVEGQAPPGWPLDRLPLPLETSMPGLFAAGDARYGSVKRVASAAGEGSVAIRMIHEHLRQSSPPGPGRATAGERPRPQGRVAASLGSHGPVPVPVIPDR